MSPSEHTPHTHMHTHTVGSSSNASSSDDEIKEAFESYSSLRQSSYVPPRCPSYSWALPKDDNAEQAFMWNPDPSVANRPVKVVPVGHKKPKFFAQMSASHNKRPHLDFDKMQHSKRLILVRFASFVWAGCGGPNRGYCGIQPRPQTPFFFQE